MFNDLFLLAFRRHILSGIKFIWDFITNELSYLGEKYKKQVDSLLNLSKVVDKIVLLCMMSGYTDFHKEY